MLRKSLILISFLLPLTSYATVISPTSSTYNNLSSYESIQVATNTGSFIATYYTSGTTQYWLCNQVPVAAPFFIYRNGATGWNDLTTNFANNELCVNPNSFPILGPAVSFQIYVATSNDSCISGGGSGGTYTGHNTACDPWARMDIDYQAPSSTPNSSTTLIMTSSTDAIIGNVFNSLYLFLWFAFFCFAFWITFKITKR